MHLHRYQRQEVLVVHDRLVGCAAQIKVAQASEANVTASQLAKRNCHLFSWKAAKSICENTENQFTGADLCCKPALPRLIYGACSRLNFVEIFSPLYHALLCFAFAGVQETVLAQQQSAQFLQLCVFVRVFYFTLGVLVGHLLVSPHQTPVVPPVQDVSAAFHRFYENMLRRSCRTTAYDKHFVCQK